MLPPIIAGAVGTKQAATPVAIMPENNALEKENLEFLPVRKSKNSGYGLLGSLQAKTLLTTIPKFSCFASVSEDNVSLQNTAEQLSSQSV